MPERAGLRANKAHPSAYHDALTTYAAPLPAPRAPARSLLLAAGSLGLTATLIAAVLPALVGAWQSELGVDAHEAGYVAAAELLAQVLGTLVFLRLDRVTGWRACAGTGLALMVAGNLACAVSGQMTTLVASRLIAGSGGGLVRALAMNCLARAKNPGQAFAIYASGQVALAALLTAAMPAILASIGLRSAFGVLAGGCAVAALLLPMLPATTLPATTLPVTTERGEERQPAWGLPGPAIWSLAGLFVFFIGQAAVWTYLAPLGAAQGIPGPAVGATLTVINFAGLVGTLAAAVLAGRSSALAMVSGLLIATLVSVGVLCHTHSSVSFAFAACVFYFSWCLSLPLQFALIAKSDATGRAGAAAPAIDGLGLACGAAMGGALIAHYGLAATGVLGSAASAAGIAAYVIGSLAHRAPASIRVGE